MVQRMCLLLASSVAVLPAIAADEPVRPGSAVVTADPLTLILGLLFVVGLILLAAWLLRRLGAVSLVGGQLIRPVATLSVGTREKIVLIDVAGKQMLVGVTAQQITPLHSYEQPVVDPDKSRSGGEFSMRFRQVMQQRTGEH